MVVEGGGGGGGGGGHFWRIGMVELGRERRVILEKVMTNLE